MPAPVLCILCERNIACLGLGFASASVSFPHLPHLLLSLLFLRSALPDHGSHASSYPGSYPPRPMVRENRSYLCCHIAQFVKVKQTIQLKNIQADSRKHSLLTLGLYLLLAFLLCFLFNSISIELMQMCV